MPPEARDTFLAAFTWEMHCATKNLTQRFVRFTSGRGIAATPFADKIGEAMVRE